MRKVNRLCQNRNFPHKKSGFYEKTAALSEKTFLSKTQKAPKNRCFLFVFLFSSLV